MLPLFSVLAFLPPDAAAVTSRASGGSPEGGPVLCVAAGTSDGLYLSRDSGISWEKVGVRDVTLGHVFGIFFDTTDPSMIYLGTSRGAFRVRLLDASERRSQDRSR